MMSIAAHERPRGIARRLALGIAAAVALLDPRAGHAQWSTTYETFYLQASHNWYFRNQYQGADRLFNGFDYGHAILYETLWTKPDAPASELEQKHYDHLTKQVLVRPPRVPLQEAAIEVAYAKLVPEAKAMFDWAHVLHRQIYDVLADERLDVAAKDREVARLVAYYKTRPDLAFSSKPKSMVLMQEQPYSLAFRTKYPKFNGLIWAYHWMQVGLYEPLVVGRNALERQAGVRATVARFWQMLADPPHTLPYQMPMTAAVAPEFSARYPEAAIIFDNLHSMHDVVSDVLANPSVPRGRKRDEILLAARRFRDDTTLVMASVDAWRTMAREMGVENMGGPAVNFMAALPTPTVTYGAVMHHDDRTGHMVSMKYGEMTGAHQMAGMPAMTNMPGMAHVSDSASHAAMMALHERMMSDPVIHARVMADPEMRRMMGQMMRDMPAEHRAHMEGMAGMHEMPGMKHGAAPTHAKGAAAKGAAAKSTARRTTTKSSAKKPARKSTGNKKPTNPHAGHAMPGMKMP
jgi:hypothetical protein